MDLSNAEETETGSGSLEGLEIYDQENKDFISGLPDPILVHILSFLPLKDAMKTVLLRRFSKLWHSISVLDIDECVYHDHKALYSGDDSNNHENYVNTKFMNMIYHISSLPYCEPLEKLCLKIWSLNYNSEGQSSADFEDRVVGDEAAADLVAKLVCYAVRRRVKVLELDFSPCLMMDVKIFKLPIVLRSHCLTDLRLSTCDIRACGDFDLEALGRFLLYDVLLSDEVMEKFLLGCPALENLRMVECYGLSKLKRTNPKLNKVMLCINRDTMHLDMSCPHVKSLEINGWEEKANLVDVSSLVDASVKLSSKLKLRTGCILRFGSFW